MFGLIYTIIASIGIYFNSIKNNIENEKNKIKYRHKDGLTYTDIKGHSRLLSNNKLVFYTYDKNGDYILKDIDGHIYRNFSKEQREKEFNERKEEAIKNGATTYCIDDDPHRNDWTCKGKRFRDFKTGDIYIIRSLNCKYYYMDISTGLIVRKTDWQRKRDEEYLRKNIKTFNKEIDINEFNKKQMTIQDKGMLYRNFDYNSSCDYYK